MGVIHNLVKVVAQSLDKSNRSQISKGIPYNMYSVILLIGADCRMASDPLVAHFQSTRHKK